MMQRSKNIFGPYTERRQLTDQNREWKEPNQGGTRGQRQGRLVFLHSPRQRRLGRTRGKFIPVTWIDGWPIIGATDRAGSPGKMVWSGKNRSGTHPYLGRRQMMVLIAGIWRLQWEWNYQSRADNWSLNERPGFHAVESV